MVRPPSRGKAGRSGREVGAHGDHLLPRPTSPADRHVIAHAETPPATEAWPLRAPRGDPPCSARPGPSTGGVGTILPLCSLGSLPGSRGLGSPGVLQRRGVHSPSHKHIPRRRARAPTRGSCAGCWLSTPSLCEEKQCRRRASDGPIRLVPERGRGLPAGCLPPFPVAVGHVAALPGTSLGLSSIRGLHGRSIRAPTAGRDWSPAGRLRLGPGWPALRPLLTLKVASCGHVHLPLAGPAACGSPEGLVPGKQQVLNKYRMKGHGPSPSGGQRGPSQSSRAPPTFVWPPPLAPPPRPGLLRLRVSVSPLPSPDREVPERSRVYASLFSSAHCTHRGVG